LGGPHLVFDLGETMNPNRRFFVLGYSGFRGFPGLKIQAWETLNFAKKPLLRHRGFFARLLPGANDGADPAPLFLSKTLPWDNEKQP
jgi:hypothetical protein